jgi:hypothetical protein
MEQHKANAGSVAFEPEGELAQVEEAVFTEDKSPLRNALRTYLKNYNGLIAHQEKEAVA